MMNQKILILDNYDSFTYNLAHLVKKLADCKVDIFRNDEIPLKGVKTYDKIILSPGPGIPDKAGILKDLIKTYAATKQILGVCLGHQAMGEVFGGSLINTQKVYHGISSEIEILDQNESLFRDLPKKIFVGRYHSWLINKEDFPFYELKITALGIDGEIMALSHKKYKLKGVQFHPESVLTPFGEKIIENWLNF